MQSLLNSVIILILILFNKRHLDKGVHALPLLLSAKENIDYQWRSLYHFTRRASAVTRRVYYTCLKMIK